ncbi:hypothetical protein [Saliphagus infecundisoli]|uniref:C2H2-type domain-containing protein n=1 Tax=Saliphagus infecundisoli TaxID=1849069 RepID=A0ABD5QKD1_9EURY|nr:hypothetical protein [Saliphagus infecundisoli]
MSPECDDCGQEFTTLSRLRLHDCPGGQRSEATDDPTTDELPTDTTDESAGSPASDSGLDRQELDRQELEREHPDVVGDLPDLIDDARAGDLSAISRAIAEYERVLTTVSRGDAPGGDDLHHDLLFAYYEPLADGLDAAAETGGWEILLEFADAYDPHEQNEFPEVGHVIANAIGRSVIRTRRSEGVDAIPADALAFLGAIPEYVDEFHVAYEESYTYGWGIDHPDHSVADHPLALAQDEPLFVKVTLNTAFYVDQHAALDVFETLVTDEAISGTHTRFGREIDRTELYFQAVADLETEQLLGPHAPPYWDEDDDLPRVVDVDPDVKQRIQDLALETGVADSVSADWSLRDLDSSLLSGILDEMSDSRDGS